MFFRPPLRAKRPFERSPHFREIGPVSYPLQPKRPALFGSDGQAHSGVDQPDMRVQLRVIT